MAGLTPAAFRKSLQARSFAPVYCLLGDEELLKAHALRDLIRAAVDPATRDFNLDIRSGAELDAETLGSLLATPPMMAERRVVVVRETSALRKEARAVLLAHLERASAPAPDLIVVLEYPAGEKGQPDRAVLEHATVVRYDPLSDRDVARWVEHFVKDELGTAITPGAASLLQQAVGGDLNALAAELDKLASFAGGAPIDEAAVSAAVGVRQGATLPDLLDAVGRRDVGRALALVPHVLALPRVSAVQVVMALGTQMLALSWARARRARGVSAGRLAGELFGFLKSGRGAYTGRPWGEAVNAWAAVVDSWDEPSLDQALAALLEADVALKGARVSRDDAVLETLVLRLCAAGSLGSRSAA